MDCGMFSLIFRMETACFVYKERKREREIEIDLLIFFVID